MSYVGTDDVVYLTEGSNGTVTVNRKKVVDAEEDNNMIDIQPYLAKVVSLGASELNKELIMNNPNGDSFTLSFDRDVTEGAENLFTGVNLVATEVDEKGSPLAAGYVRLRVKDTKNYLVVDTALHAGSEANKQLPKFAYDDPGKEVVDGNNVRRMPESFNFKFAYDPTSNRVLMKVQKYAKKISVSRPAIVSGATNTGDGNTAYTYWPYGTYVYYEDGENTSSNGVAAENTNFVSDAYVRLVELSSVRELTVASKGMTSAEENTHEWYTDVVGNVLGADHLTYGMLTNVTIGKGVMAYEPTTIPTGLYMIQYIKGDEQKATANDYFVANLGGFFGYAEQAKNQDYDHIPAAQWYVKQQGSIPTAPVTITNREFFDQK